MVQEALRSEQVQEICTRLQVQSPLAHIRTKSWVKSFTERTIEDMSSLLGGRNFCIGIRPISDPQVIFTPTFSRVLDGSLQDMTEFLEKNAKLEGFRLGIYRIFGSNNKAFNIGEFGRLLFPNGMKSEVEDILKIKIVSKEDLQEVARKQQPMADQSIARVLTFRVQERLLVPFIVSAILGDPNYQPAKIVDFLRDPSKELGNVYLNRREVVNGVYEEENRPHLAKLRQDIEAAFTPDPRGIVFLEPVNLADLNAGRVSVDRVENCHAFGVYLNGTYIGRVKQDVPGHIVYSPKLRVLPFDWAAKDIVRQTVFVER